MVAGGCGLRDHMNDNKTENRLSKDFIINLREGKVIPFIGAGLSLGITRVDGKRAFPTWKGLFSNGVSFLEKAGKNKDASYIQLLIDLERKSPQELADELRISLNEKWGEFLIESFDLRLDEVIPESLVALNKVWQITDSLIITTNYDHSLRWSSPSPDFNIWDISSPINQSEFLSRGIQGKVIWHLHGSIDNASNIILDSPSYESLYSDTDERFKAALFLLRSVIAQNSLLFIGFSLTDEFFLQQIHHIRKLFSDSGISHYIITHKIEVARIKSLNLGLNVIEVSDYDTDFLNLLDDIIQVKIGEEAGEIGESHEHPQSHFFVPFKPKGDRVFGRAETTNIIRETLDLMGDRAYVSITGIGGLGKTQAAIEYAYARQDDYPGGIFWFSADTDLIPQLINYSQSLSLIPKEAEDSAKVASILSFFIIDTKKLLLFDNAEADFDFTNFIPMVHPSIHMLCTSRTTIRHSKILTLDFLQQQEAEKLLVSEATTSPNSVPEWEALKAIASVLDGLPLAIELAGGYIKTLGLNFLDYLHLLEINSIETLNRPDLLTSYTEYNRDIKSVLHMSSSYTLSYNYLDDILSISAPREVPLDYILHMLDVSVVDKIITDIMIGNNLRLFDYNREQKSFKMHTLIRELRYHHLIEGDKYEKIKIFANRAILWFARRVKDQDYRYAYDRDHDHIDLLFKLCEFLPPLTQSKILWLSSYTNFYRGQFNEAKEKLISAKEIYQDNSLKDPEFLANLHNDLAQNEFTDITYILKNENIALEIRTDLFGEHHKDTIISLANYATSLSRHKRDKNAAGYIIRALNAAEAVHGPNSREYARICIQASDIYSNIGDNILSIFYTDKARGILTKIGLSLSKEMADLLNFQGQVYFHSNKPKEAVSKLNSALEIIEGIYDENNPMRATFYHNLGMVYLSAGLNHKSIRYFEQSSDINKKLYGIQHPAYISSISMLVKCIFFTSNKNKQMTIQRIDQILDEYEHTKRPQYLSDIRRRIILNQNIKYYE